MDINELQRIANKYLRDEEEEVPSNIIEDLKQKLSADSIGIAQINPKQGDIDYNYKKIAQYIIHAQNIGLKLIVFPEMSLLGYPLNDTLKRHPYIANNCLKRLEELAQYAANTTALVGFVEPDEITPNNNTFFSSLAVLSGGKVKDIIRRSTLLSGFDTKDYKYISPSLFENYKLHNTLVTIGDGCFSDIDLSGVSAIINCSARSAREEAHYSIHNKLSELSEKYNVQIMYANQTGASDSVIFEGSSRFYNTKGEVTVLAEPFEEGLLIVNPKDDENKPAIEFKNAPIEQTSFSLDYEYDLERTYKTILLGIKDYFKKCGLKRAVLGLSGGLDSTVCAVLLVDALGKDNVLGVSMPSKITSIESKSDAEMLAKNLGINFITAPIKPMVETVNTSFDEAFKEIEKGWDGRYKESYTQDNIQARTRATILWGISNEFSSCIPIATSDKSEAYMGYATINGDMSGGFAPIADITKTKLFALAKWLNNNREQRNAIPESIIKKRPGAELAINPKTGKPLIAEDALMPYEFLDEVIFRIENKNESINDMLESEFLYEKNNTITKEQKKEWLNKFFKRMSNALYKWSIMPPSIMVEPHSINHVDFTRPITSRF